ncbi:MAG: radical SAM protein [Candidatus Heimdallarchaeota archaeon]
MNYRFVKGKVNALGVKDVLKVGFNPIKICNFDCVYCIVGRTNKCLNNRIEFYTVSEIFNEIYHYIRENGTVPYVLLTGSGEPALYSGFGELVEKIKDNFPEIGIMAYTNATLLSRKDVQNEFARIDILGCTINSVYLNEFHNICRPNDEVNLKNALEGLKEFSRHFTGMLIVDSKFVHGLNDTERNVEGLIEYLSEVQPNEYSVVTRKHHGQNLTKEFISFLEDKMSDLPFPVSIQL